jgi:hypothetical protein
MQMHSYTNGGPLAATLLPPIPTRTIVGAGLANRHLDKRQRACLAADVIDGVVKLNPSMKQLADIFGVSTTYIELARKLPIGKRAAILRGWDQTSFAELMPRRSAMLPALITDVKAEIPDIVLENLARSVGVERMLAAAVAVEHAA